MNIGFESFVVSEIHCRCMMMMRDATTISTRHTCHILNEIINMKKSILQLGAVHVVFVRQYAGTQEHYKTLFPA